MANPGLAVCFVAVLAQFVPDSTNVLGRSSAARATTRDGSGRADMLARPCGARARYGPSPGARSASGWSRFRCGAGSAEGARGHGAGLSGADRAGPGDAAHPVARRGHLRPADVGLLRPLRHARRRPRPPAAPHAGRTIRSPPTASSAWVSCRPTACNAPSGGPGRCAPTTSRCRGCTGAGSSFRTARSCTCWCAIPITSRAARRSWPRRSTHGLVFYWAVPTAPPWYAGEIERIPPVGGSWWRPASGSGNASGHRFTIHLKAIRSLPCHPSTSAYRWWPPDCCPTWAGARGPWAGPMRSRWASGWSTWASTT